jgi:transposase
MFRYPAEFRADAVALVGSSGKPIAQVAKEVGVNHETLRTWIRAAEAAERPGAGRGRVGQGRRAGPAAQTGR